MTQLEKIEAEIVKRTYNAHEMPDSRPDKRFYEGKDAAYGEILSIIDSLKEQEPQALDEGKDEIDTAFTKMMMGEYPQKIKGWVAREPTYNLMLFTEKPERFGNMWDCMCGEEMPINASLFPNLTWEDEPIEVEAIIKRV